MEDDPKPIPPEQSSFQRLWSELKRRHVVRVAMVYAIVGWLVIQVANATFSDFGIPAWANRFVVLMVVLGFPISAVLAWAFELTPEGIKTSKTAREEHPESHKDASHAKKRSWLAYAIGAVVPTFIFGALALFFYIQSGDGTSGFDGEKSIAVLPFDNRSERKEDEFFTDGIHDDLLTQISHIRDLKTIARTSVMGYRNTTKSMKLIGEELGVRTLLEGGVQRSGNQIRINVQLIDAETDAHLWAETYTRELNTKNVFDIQSEVSVAIANELKAILSDEEKEQLDKLPTETLAALEAYFKGKEITQRIDQIPHFEKAIMLDPSFALAHSALASALLNYNGIRIPRDQKIAKAESHILIALDIDDTLSEAYTALGVLKHRQDDYESAKRAHKKAIELNPNNAIAYYRYFQLLNLPDYDGSRSERLRMLQKSIELDPYGRLNARRLGYDLELSGRLDDAQKHWENITEERPLSDNNHAYFAGFHRKYRGRFDEAIIAYRKAYSLEPYRADRPSLIHRCYLNLGDFENALWWLERRLSFNLNNVGSIRHGYWKFIFMEDKSGAEQSVIEGLKQYPGDGDLLSQLTDLYIAAGQPEGVIPQWKQAYPTFFAQSPRVVRSNGDFTPSVARVLTRTGERQQASRIIEAALETARAEPDKYYRRLEADLHAIGGDDQQALDAIGRFFDAGGSPYVLMFYHDELKRFETNPQYQAMAEKRKAELTIQLTRIHEMEANGELAPIPELPAN